MSNRFTIEYTTSYIPDTGFSAWVHVRKGERDRFAHHVGYYDNPYTAEDKAKNAAQGIYRGMELAGRKPLLQQGDIATVAEVS